MTYSKSNDTQQIKRYIAIQKIYRNSKKGLTVFCCCVLYSFYLLSCFWSCFLLLRRRREARVGILWCGKLLRICRLSEFPVYYVLTMLYYIIDTFLPPAHLRVLLCFYCTGSKSFLLVFLLLRSLKKSPALAV